MVAALSLSEKQHILIYWNSWFAQLIQNCVCCIDVLIALALLAYKPFSKIILKKLFWRMMNPLSTSSGYLLTEQL